MTNGHKLWLYFCHFFSFFVISDIMFWPTKATSLTMNLNNLKTLFNFQFWSLNPFMIFMFGFWQKCEVSNFEKMWCRWYPHHCTFWHLTLYTCGWQISTSRQGKYQNNTKNEISDGFIGFMLTMLVILVNYFFQIYLNFQNFGVSEIFWNLPQLKSRVWHFQPSLFRQLIFFKFT